MDFTFDQKLNSTRKARRLYIGNIPIHMGVTETSFQEFIFKVMKDRGFCVDPDNNPVVCVWFAKDKNYGFVEFATVDETERAMMLDGTPCMGVPLKISRPNDYTQTNAGAVATNPEAALAQIAAAGGNVPGLTLPYGSMQGALGIGGPPPDFDYGQPPPPPPLPAITSDPVLRVSGVHGGRLRGELQVCSTVGMLLFAGGSVGNASLQGSRCVRVIQVANSEVLSDPQESEEVLADMVEGCGSKVLRCCLITNKETGLVPHYTTGDVFLQVETAENANSCVEKMGVRKYDHKMIQIEKISDADWAQYIEPISRAPPEME
eukprot:Platyproteum_vivax@DN5541_c0_g1_i10.p1